jgi:hypothetical protein
MKLRAIAAATMFAASVSATANAQQQPTAPGAGIMTVTIENVGRPYDVLDGVCVYQQFAGFSLRGDPLPNALARAMQQIGERARAVQADALVGMDVDFDSPSEGEEGRVMVCGTLVRFRAR